MSHNHTRTAFNYNKAFIIGILLNALYIIVEVFIGITYNSMALLADAGHNFSDVLGLVLAGGASYLSQKAATKTKTYGMRKTTILAALINAILLLIAVGAITIEAIQKIFEPQPVSGFTVMVVAGIGVVTNTFTALLFVKGRHSDINIKGAFLHMAADAAVSLGVVAGGFIIYFTGWYLVDPIISLIIVIVITLSTWELLKDSFRLSIDAVPKDIDFIKVREYLASLDGVNDVHDLHIWPMSTTETALTVHLVVEKQINTDRLIQNIAKTMETRYFINHVTIQTETNDSDDCKQRPDYVV
ncbi:MAG: cation diffusion facilitator family transporter [Caldithrix sp.]|nr:cation diffusion facilitator family transporter [Caldithrix sp.]